MTNAIVDSTALVVLTNLGRWILETNPNTMLYNGKLGDRMNIKFACKLAEEELARLGYDIPERRDARTANVEAT